MFQGLLDTLFGCTHKNFTFPRSSKHGSPAAGSLTGTYVVCLDCGKEFPYDWRQMKVVSASARPGVTEPQPYANRVA